MILAFVIQWVVFVPAYLLQTERFFDLTGSLTYITVAIVAVLLSAETDARSYLLLAMVVIWAARLGSYLFRRIRKAGADARFDEIKPSFPRFLNTWTLQGLWVTLTLSAALAAITTTERVELGAVTAIGLLVWVVGIGLEATADAQKSRFRADPANKGRFIQQRTVVVVAPSQLLRRDPALDRRGDRRAARAPRVAVGDADLARVRRSCC